MSGPANSQGDGDVERTLSHRDQPRRGVRGPTRVLFALVLIQALGVIELESSAEPDTTAKAEATMQRESTVPSPPSEDVFAAARHAMVESQIAARGVSDTRVLDAMRRVPRHEFVPEGLRDAAYRDGPLPIGQRQTISQPFIVAAMTEAARLDESSKVLEVGTGSGYQAAVLAEVAGEVYSIEIIPGLAERARALLHRTGYERVHLRLGDGYAGWPEASPFDAILVTAAPPEIPAPLIEQLAVGGRMVIPVGRGHQELTVLTKTESGVERESLLPVLFVPMTGKAQELD